MRQWLIPVFSKAVWLILGISGGYVKMSKFTPLCLFNWKSEYITYAELKKETSVYQRWLMEIALLFFLSAHVKTAAQLLLKPMLNDILIWPKVQNIPSSHLYELSGHLIPKLWPFIWKWPLLQQLQTPSLPESSFHKIVKCLSGNLCPFVGSGKDVGRGDLA